MRSSKNAELDDRFEAMIAATASGHDADRRLAAMLADPGTGTWHKVLVAAALGNVAAGPAGSAALRDAFTDATAKHAGASKSSKSTYRDLICASVTALAKREGRAATDVLASAASSPERYVRDYGIRALATVGDDSAWEQVMARLDEILVRKRNSNSLMWQEALKAIEYLARHAPQGSERAVQLVTLLRDRWRNLGDPDLIDYWWPDVHPGGEPASTIDFK